MTLRAFALTGLACWPLLVTSSERSEPAARDGVWWGGRSVEARTAYAGGFVDCAVYDALRAEAKNASWPQLQELVSSQFKASSKDIRLPVSSIMKRVIRPVRPPQSPGGEEYAEKHGIFDGNFWRMLGPEGQLMFVTGYWDCLKEYRLEAPHLRRTLSVYVARINEWYGTDPEDQMAGRLDRIWEKIAIVFRRVVDEDKGKAK